MNLKSKKSLLIISFIISLFLLVFLTMRFYIIGNVTVKYYSSVEVEDSDSGFIGFGPCETNKIAPGAEVKFVFTEPFVSLDSYEQAKVIKTLKTDSGVAKTFLSPGKYGLYMEFKDGQKKLYSDLKIDNASNNSLIREQGPWYVQVDAIGSGFSFTDSLPC